MRKMPRKERIRWRAGDVRHTIRIHESSVKWRWSDAEVDYFLISKLINVKKIAWYFRGDLGGEYDHPTTQPPLAVNRRGGSVVGLHWA